MLQEQENIVLIIAGTILLLLMGIFVIGFLFFYQKKHNSHISEKAQLQLEFNQEMLKAQLEIQEQTLSHMSREIHDNVGQVLSFIKLSLASVKRLDAEQSHLKIDESRELLTQAINDLRDLSKSLSFERIQEIGLSNAIAAELERVNKSGLITAYLHTEGEPKALGPQRELVLFRIFQEAINNTLKYAAANALNVDLKYSADLFTLTVEDNGAGFSVNEALLTKAGSGLNNMISRATLIGARADLKSTAGKGSSIIISLTP
jgi:signal transduction histidine kinase